VSDEVRERRTDTLRLDDETAANVILRDAPISVHVEFSHGEITVGESTGTVGDANGDHLAGNDRHHCVRLHRSTEQPRERTFSGRELLEDFLATWQEVHPPTTVHDTSEVERNSFLVISRKDVGGLLVCPHG
jgi:hypothetical protein